MRLLRAFVQQLDATVVINSPSVGTEFVVLIPMEAKH